jgi:hypothetical protein
VVIPAPMHRPGSLRYKLTFNALTCTRHFKVKYSYNQICLVFVLTISVNWNSQFIICIRSQERTSRISYSRGDRYLQQRLSRTLRTREHILPRMVNHGKSSQLDLKLPKCLIPVTDVIAGLLCLDSERCT